MSLNELVSNDVKPWLNIRCNNIKIDGEMTSKNFNPEDGWVLQADADGFAYFGPPPFSNSISNTSYPFTTVAITFVPTLLSVGVSTHPDPFLTVFGDIGTINTAGTYLILSRLSINIANSDTIMEVLVNGIQDPYGTLSWPHYPITLFSPLSKTSFTLRQLSIGDTIQWIAYTVGANSSLDVVANSSSFTIIKVA